MAAFGKTRRRRELPLKSGLKKVERQLCADSGHLCGVQNLGLWALCGRMHWQRNRVPTTSDNGHSAGCYALFVSAVLMSGFGGRIGGHIMPRVQLPAVTPKHRAWNKGRIIGQKRPLLPKQVWAIRARLELSGYLRDLALFNVAIDSKLRGCDLVKLAVADLVKDDRVRERVSIVQSKTKKPVQFELTENTRDTVIAWVRSPEMIGCRFMFPSRFHDRPHISTRQYGRLVRDWVTAIGLEPSGYGTHSMRRTKAAEIYRKTGNLRAVQLLLGHTKVDSTVRYLGVELEDALSIAERIDI